MKLKLNEDFYTHKELNPVLFKNNKLKPEIREALLNIAHTFIDEVKSNEVPLNVCDYWIVGSNASYNYGPNSDIDIHIIVNMDSIEIDPRILTILYNYAKSSFNKDHNIKIKGHEVEVYIEDMNTTSISDGIYSIQQDKWIKVPQPKEETVLDIKEEPEYREWEDKYRSLVIVDIDEINKFINELYQMRKESLVKDGEFGIGNLIFKEFRNMGRLDDLKNQIKKLESEKLTVEQLNESKNDKYYRFTIKDKNGRDTDTFFTAIEGVLKPYVEDEDILYFFIDDLDILADATPVPDKDIKNAKFAYKKSFVDDYKDVFEDLEHWLKKEGYGLITKVIEKPSDIVYEDEVQIAYAPNKGNNVERKISESIEKDTYIEIDADEIVAGLVNNVSEDEIDSMLRYLSRAARLLGVKDYNSLKALKIYKYSALNDISGSNGKKGLAYNKLDDITFVKHNSDYEYVYLYFRNEDERDKFLKIADTKEGWGDEAIKLREKQERTVYNALNAWKSYKLKYGDLDSFFELKYNFRLTDEEILWIINKIFEKGLIDDYTKDNAIDYLKLQEQLSKRNEFKTSINEALKRNLNENTSNIFDVNHINIPFYNDMLKSSEARKRENREMEIVQMSPKEYFKECAKIFNSTFDSQIRQIKTDDETLDYIKSEIEKGNKLPLTWLDYSEDKSQDGRHRMYVLGELFGWDEKYPVAIFTTADEKEAERREKEKEVARISKYFYWMEKKLFGYSYRDLDELKEEIEYLISDYLDDVKIEITQVGSKLLIDVNNVELEYNVDDFDWVKENENRLELDPDDFDRDDIELDIL